MDSGATFYCFAVQGRVQTDGFQVPNCFYKSMLVPSVYKKIAINSKLSVDAKVYCVSLFVLIFLNNLPV